MQSMFCFPVFFLHRETILAVALFSLFEVGIVLSYKRFFSVDYLCPWLICVKPHALNIYLEV